MATFGLNFSNNIAWTGTSTTYYPTMTVTSAGPIVSPPEPKKRTPIDWLDAEVERMCAVARDALVSA